MEAYKPTIMERLQRFPIVRNRDFLVKRSQKRQQARALPLDHSKSIMKDLDVERVLAQLKTDGLALNLTLPDSMSDVLMKHAMEAPCCAFANPEHGFLYQDRSKVSAALGRPLLKSDYLNIRKEIPGLREFCEDPKLVDLASRYLGFPAVCIRTRLWWSFAPQNEAVATKDLSQAAMLFHFDSADFRFMKFFFYLNDVGPENGPHVFVKGTHKKKKFMHYLSSNQYTDEEMSQLYGADKVVTITGKAGSGFAEDTFGFHKAEMPQQRDRLVFMIMFSHSDSNWEDAKGDISMLPLETNA